MTSYDDASINNLLDDLISSAKKDSDVKSIDATTSQNDVIFTCDTVHEGIDAANVLLLAAHQEELPHLEEDEREKCDHYDTRTVLAATLTALVRMTRANAANVTLREQAEARVRDAAIQLESADESAASFRQRMEAAIDSATAARRRADVTTREKDSIIRKYTGETGELKTRLQAAIGREKMLVQTVQRKEKDIALLKQRVHAIVNSSRTTPVLQRITSASSVDFPSNRSLPDSRRLSEKKASRAETARLRVCEEENHRFRNLLRAVQEELDDLLVNCDRSASSSPHTSANNEARIDKKSQSNSECDKENEQADAITVEGNEEEENESQDAMSDKTDEKVLPCMSSMTLLSNCNIVPAPTEKQMSLPFEMIREEFESSLERKFEILRSVLTGAQ